MNPDLNTLAWHDCRSAHGFEIRAYFFDPGTAEAQTDFGRRMVPVFKRASPQVWVTDADKTDFRAGNLIARPDAVLVHNNCLISLEYKSQSGRLHTIERWPRELPTAGLLQCLAAAIVVAVETGRQVAPILRCHNAMYFLHPRQEVVEYLIKQVDLAPSYWQSQDRLVAAGDLAKQCEPWLRKTFRLEDAQNRAQSDAGRARHQTLLRR